MRLLSLITATLFVMTILLIPIIDATTFGYTYLDNTISGNITYQNNTYINQTQNVTFNTTQFETGEPVTIKVSWLTSFIEGLSKWSNYVPYTGATAYIELGDYGLDFGTSYVTKDGLWDATSLVVDITRHGLYFNDVNSLDWESRILRNALGTSVLNWNGSTLITKGINASGSNISADYFIGDASLMSGIPSPDLSAYWENDGTSTATGNWDIGAYTFNAFNLQTIGSSLFYGTKNAFATITSTNSIYAGQALFGGGTKTISGTANTILGTTAVGLMTTGFGNTVLGYGAGSRLTSGYRNVNVGSESGGSTTNFQTTSMGYRAGLYTIGSAAFNNAANSVYIGALTESSTATTTNEIVIGANADGKGSNTVVLGDDAITQTWLKGNVYLQDDNDNIFFGTGNDASFGYDGTNMIINPKVVGSGILRLLGSLFIDGNLNQTNGNATINNIYGGMWYHNDTATALSFAVDGEFYHLFMQNATHINGFTANNIGFGLNSSLTTQVAGTYQASFMSTGSGENNHVYHTSIFINEVNQRQCEHDHKMTAGGDILTQSGICFIDLEVGQNVSIRTANIGNTGTGNYYSSNLNLLRVGN